MASNPFDQFDAPAARGQLEAGNIDLHARPVVRNTDGSISTVRSISANFDGREVLIPTVSDDGRVMSNDEAIQAYRNTGRHLGVFSSPEDATAYAESLHADQAAEYGDKGANPFDQFDAIEAPAKPPRSIAQEVGRQGALAGRAVLEGLGDLASIPANALAGLGNLLLELDRRIAGNQDRAVIGDQSRGVSAVLDAVGVPAPETDTEKLVNTIGRRATGAAATVGTGTVLQGAQGVTAGVGQSLASNPVLQAVGSATGPVAAEIAKEAGAGKTGQTIADLAGSIAPSVIASGAQATTRGGFRGGEEGRKTVERNIETFRRVGTTPTVGQATESRINRGAESLLSRTPGGSGPIVQKAEQQADDLARSIEQKAAQLVRKTSAEQAGRQIQRSISGEGGFVDRFKAQQTKLYDELDRFIPETKRVSVAKTQAALKDLNQNIEGAENVSKFFQNAKIKGIESALVKDIEARPELDDAAADILEVIRKADPAKAEQWAAEIFRDGKLPYEAVKKLRTLVGREMADAGIASDVPRSKWKALYAALSDDLGGAVEGNAAAKSAWSRANNYTRAGMRRIEAIESVIDKNGGPEAVFRAATSNTKEGATTLRAVMQSVDDEGKKMISATVLRRLGLAKAGVQGELGERFSTESFLTNWNLLSPEAKRALFDRYGPRFRADMDQVAKVAANLREGSQVFRNPSGTGQATAQAATVGGLAGAIITGHLGTAGTIGAGVAGANLTSRLMRNPRFVRWLARSTHFPEGAYAGQVNALLQQGRQSEDEDLVQAALYLKDRQPEKAQQNKGR